MFYAQLKMKGTDEQKTKKVDDIIYALGLTKCQYTLIGDNLIKGISGGERKRVCIGVELVSSPDVLILDEPTSGLDSFTAFSVIKTLHDLAKE